MIIVNLMRFATLSSFNAIRTGINSNCVKTHSPPPPLFHDTKTNALLGRGNVITTINAYQSTPKTHVLTN